MKIDLNLGKKYSVFIDELQEIKLKGKVAIITNPKVGGLWLDFLLQRLDCEQKFIITIPDGEEYKNTASVEQILEKLFGSKLDRKSTLIALGGGVISDITGFCASIYERGIDFINIPTTLLAQVDASVGGKTGVNNRFGKNLIGSFYQPRAVYCESKFLSTLPAREFAAGVAEAVKMAVCFDVELFKFFETHDLKSADEISHIIARCVAIKADVVARDERENGVRAVLNYGHTFAHAIEKITDYKKFLHGEAVAIGMAGAADISEQMGLLRREDRLRIERLIEAMGLPLRANGVTVDGMYADLFHDKKTVGGRVHWVLAEGIGRVSVRSDVPEEIVRRALAGLCR